MAIKFETAVTEELAQLGATVETADIKQLYEAVSRAAAARAMKKGGKRVKGRRASYLSAEFLTGRVIYANLLNAGLTDDFVKMMESHGANPQIFEKIGDPALGNGGLGRLAACFLESAAWCGLPLDGYGIRYRYGLFRQSIEDGFQREYADDWLKWGDPWSIRRESDAVRVKFGDGEVTAVPYDMPIIGKNASTVNTLRLWQAESDEPFDFELFNMQKYDKAADSRLKAERLSDVLYPNDDTDKGKKLRLKQEYFFCAASIEDMLKKCGASPFSQMYAVQLNDSHPTVAIPELIRRLTERGMNFNEAFEQARAAFSYTNHTVMPEALEKWSLPLMRSVIPQIVPILRSIQKRLRAELGGLGVTDFTEFDIIESDTVHMARLAMFVCHKVNGVAKIHTEIIKQKVFKPWNDIRPGTIINITNGITPRRWLRLCNPELAKLISQKLDTAAAMQLKGLDRLREFADDPEFKASVSNIKRIKKEQLAHYIFERERIEIRTDAIYDVQIKRIHEYKRQLLNILSVLDVYFRIKDGSLTDFTPTVYIFGGKAAPGYYRAKAVIKLINSVASLISEDRQVSGLMQVVFVTDYNVSYAEKIIPAADISEQISLAGTEASGTGNMKLMLNGAVTLGTYDGANIEIAEAAGRENNYIFGMTVEEAEKLKDNYDPSEYIDRNPRLKRAVDALTDGTLSDSGSGMFEDLRRSLYSEDPYMVCADFESYCNARDRANRDWRDGAHFDRMRIMNIAGAGRFSSDRAVQEYANKIWRIKK